MVVVHFELATGMYAHGSGKTYPHQTGQSLISISILLILIAPPSFRKAWKASEYLPEQRVWSFTFEACKTTMCAVALEAPCSKLGLKRAYGFCLPA